jgi:hypothetical protein
MTNQIPAQNIPLSNSSATGKAAAYTEQITGGLVDALLRQASVRPNHPAILDGEKEVSYGELSGRSAAVAEQLTVALSRYSERR